jgi:TP901 family phage tail tape measure protein
LAVTGSNELNMLLKAKVVKIRVELDAKNSGLSKQISEISKMLIEKPVKLKVKLTATVAELNTQLSEISKTIHESKTFKPLKIAVEIDVKGSATNIKKQLQDVHKVVEEFNKKYSTQLKQMQEKTAQAQAQVSKVHGINVPMDAGVTNFNNIKQYVNQLKEAERIMKSKLGKGQNGLFNSFEIKDAKGNLQGFIATLEKANGVVDKVRYSFNKDKNAFQVVDRTTSTNTEKLIHKQMQALQDLQREIDKTGKKSAEFQKEYNALMNAGANGSLTADAVKGLQTRIKNEQVLIQTTKAESDSLREQAKLIAEINRARGKMSGGSSQANALTGLKSQLNSLKSGDFKDPAIKSFLADIKRQFSEVKSGYDDQITKEKKLANVIEKRRDLLTQLKNIEKTTSSTSKNSPLYSRNIEEVRALVKQIRTMEDYIAVKKRKNEIDRAVKSQKVDNSIVTQLEKAKKAMQDYLLSEGRTMDLVEKRFAMMKRNIGTNLQQLTSETAKWKKMSADASVKASMAQKANSLVMGVDNKHVKSLIDAKDTVALKEYIGQLNNARVATLKLQTDSKGNSKIITQFESIGKNAKQMTYEIRSADNQLRHFSQGEVFNRNANLGIFEQLRIAMARVPVWMVAMTAFYGTIRVIKSMADEILNLDKSLTELKRVASKDISIDTVFSGALSLSKELGSNIHQIMDSVSELARTFGDFNERQLLAITRTATLMSNVSDLTPEEATKNLVGTMNAFNISASESIHIVDALNEVDNNYAISTKQLAEGLGKSASTAKTFGVTMEESVGNITAIGAVTMESGNIIGTSLKTIYSRITTLKDSESILDNVGVKMRAMGADGVEAVRPVNDILNDLADKWATLTAEQQQNTAVQLAGRNQLSRFLALMNNHAMAVDATTTAISSEGSAMRENAEYLKSFEARINSLKNGFTELSSSVGDAILSGGMLFLISALTKLASIAVVAVKQIGVLPVVFLLVAGALGKMKILTSLHNGMGNLITYYTKSAKEARILARETQRAGTNVVAFGAEARAGMSTATVATRTFGAVFKGVMASTLIGVGFVAIGWGIEKLIALYQRHKHETEELIKLNKKLVDGYRKHQDGMQGLIDRYEELDNKQSKSSNEQAEYLKLQHDLATQLPTVVAYVDANGKAHLKNVDAIREEIKSVALLSKEQAKLDQMKYTEKLGKQVESYEKINEKIEKLIKANDKLGRDNGKEKTTVVQYGDKKVVETKVIDNTEEMQKNKVKFLMFEAEKTEALKKTIKTIQASTLSWFEANGQMSALGDSQQKVVENFIQYNESILRNAEDQSVAIEGLGNVGKSVGSVFVEAFDKLSKGIGDNPLEIQKIKDGLDGVAKSLPRTFYEMADANGNVTKSQEDVVLGLKEIVNVSHQVKEGNTDQDGLIKRLQATGLSAEDAKGYLFRLATQEDNVALRSKLASEGIDAQTGSLEDLSVEALKAIDLTSTLFGYSNEDLDSVKQHIIALKLLTETRGKDAKSTQDYQNNLQELANFFSVTTSEIEANKSKYYELADALTKVDLSAYDGTVSWKAFVESNKNLTNAQKDAVLAFKGSQDFITGENTHLMDSNNLVVDSAKKTKGAIQDVFDMVNAPEGSPIALMQIKGSINYIGDGADTLIKKVDAIKKKLGEQSSGSPMLDGLIAGLETSNGKLANTEHNAQTLKKLVSDPFYAGYLKDVQDQSDNTNVKLDTTKGKVDGVKLSIGTPVVSGGVLKPFDKDLENSMSKMDIFSTKYTNTSGLLANPVKDLNPLNGLNQLIGNTTTSAEEARAGIDKTVKKGSEVASINNDLDVVEVKAKKVKSAITKLNTTLNELGTGFSNSDVGGKLGAIGVKSDAVKGQVNGLRSSLSKIGGNIKGIEDYESAIGRLSGNLVLATQYGQRTADAQAHIVTAFKQVVGIVGTYGLSISKAGSNVGSTFSKMAKSVKSATNAMVDAYSKNKKSLGIMASYSDKKLKDIAVDFGTASKKVPAKVKTMADAMHKEFKSGAKKIVASAGKLPSQIGEAVKSHMSDATDSMDSLANNMVSRFRKELGIHSPSRVFKKLGGHVVEGLVHGLQGHDLSTLGKDVFSEFGGGVFDSMDTIKAYLSGGMGGMGDVASGSVKDWLTSAIKSTGVSMNWLNPLYSMAMKESGGNPKAINLWDSNAKAGHPSQGLMQTIPSTFNAYKMSGFNDILNPIHNAIASIRYILSKYGSIFNTPGIKNMSKGGGYKGYANGGIIDKMELAWHGEEGAEAIIPLTKKRKKRGVQLWEEAGQRLGIDPQIFAYLKKILGGSGATAHSGSDVMGASSGEGGEASGGGSGGTSGIIMPSTPSVLSGGYNLDGGFEFHALASKSGYHYEGNKRVYDDPKVQQEVNAKAKAESKSKNSKQVVKDNIAEAVTYDKLARSADAYEASISLLEAKIAGMDKTSGLYRDTLRKIISYSNSHLAIQKKDLALTTARQSMIERSLKTLPALGKQSSAQRDTYNKLQQEYDTNIGKISTLKSSIETEAIAIRDKTKEIFMNLVDQIKESYDKAIEAMNDKMGNIDFKMSVLELTDPNNVKEKLKLEDAKVQEYRIKQKTFANEKIVLEKKLAEAVKHYGSTSEQAQSIKADLRTITDSYEEATLGILQGEKDIRDIRAEEADKAIAGMKEYYGKAKDLALQAKDDEKKIADDAHTAQMKIYDDEIAKINEKYDAVFKKMDAVDQAETYQTDLKTKTDDKTTLVNKIALLSRDKSLEGRKKLKDAQDELVAKQKEIDDFMKDHQKELLKQQLQDQKDQQIAIIETKKETEQANYDILSKRLDDEKEVITKHYDDIINDETRWTNMRDEAIKGTYTLISAEMTNLNTEIKSQNSDLFKSLSDDFSKYYATVNQSVADLKSNTTPTDTTYDGVVNPVVDPVVEPVAKQGRLTTGVFTDKKTADTMNKIMKDGHNAKSSKVISSNGGWRTVSDFDTVSKAEAVLAYEKLKKRLGTGYVTAFDTGGYTGDWSGNDGKMAMLHKKEIVLNERQTSDILDTAKIMDKIKDFIPNLARNSVASQVASAGGMSITNNYELNINIGKLEGDKKGADIVVKEIMKGLKKLGK